MPPLAASLRSPVARAAAVAAAATLGVLAGLGARDGTPLVVLETAGLRLRGIPEFIAPDPGAGWSALLGAAHAALVAFAWGALAARLAGRLRALEAVLAAIALGTGIALVDPMLPVLLRLGAGATGAGQRAVCVAARVGAAVLVALGAR